MMPHTGFRKYTVSDMHVKTYLTTVKTYLTAVTLVATVMTGGVFTVRAIATVSTATTAVLMAAMAISFDN